MSNDNLNAAFDCFTRLTHVERQIFLRSISYSVALTIQELQSLRSDIDNATSSEDVASQAVEAIKVDVTQQ